MLLVRLLLLLVLCADAVAARVCELTGENAPEVVTVMASKIDPNNQLWIVRPNCEVDVTILGASPSFTSQRNDIERIDSVPTTTTLVSLPLAPLSRGADFSKAAQLRTLKIKRFADVVLPSALLELDISGSSLTSLSGVKFPETLQILDLSSTQLTSLQGVILPDGISDLVLSNTKITAIDFKLPSQLRDLDLSSTPLKSVKGVVFPPLVRFLNLARTTLTAIDVTTYPAQLYGLSLDYATITRIERITIPDQIVVISCISCGLTTVRGVKWSRSLGSLLLDGNPIVNFEIRRSDLAILRKATFTGEVIQPSARTRQPKS